MMQDSIYVNTLCLFKSSAADPNGFITLTSTIVAMPKISNPPSKTRHACNRAIVDRPVPSRRLTEAGIQVVFLRMVRQGRFASIPFFYRTGSRSSRPVDPEAIFAAECRYCRTVYHPAVHMQHRNDSILIADLSLDENACDVTLSPCHIMCASVAACFHAPKSVQSNGRLRNGGARFQDMSN
jgi:hypothetical protein